MFDLFGLEKDHKIKGDDEIDLLITVYDVAMLGMVRGLLEEENIPYLVHERGTGSAMRIITGFSMFGTDIYVPKDALEHAKDLIAGLDAQGGEVEILDEDAEADAPDGGTEE